MAGPYIRVVYRHVQVDAQQGGGSYQAQEPLVVLTCGCFILSGRADASWALVSSLSSSSKDRMAAICCYCLSGICAVFVDNNACFLLMETSHSHPSLGFGSPDLTSPALLQGRYLAEQSADSRFHVIQTRSTRPNNRTAAGTTREDISLFPRASQ